MLNDLENGSLACCQVSSGMCRIIMHPINAVTGEESLEVVREEGRDAASVFIELDAENFAEERFFGADTNAVAEKKNNDGSAKRPPAAVSQACGDHQAEHP